MQILQIEMLSILFNSIKVMFHVGHLKGHLSLDRSASSLAELANWKTQGWAQRREGMDKESFYPRAEHCPLTVVRSQNKGPRRPGVDTCEGAELQETNVRFSLLHSSPSTIWSGRLTLPPKCHGNLEKCSTSTATSLVQANIPPGLGSRLPAASLFLTHHKVDTTQQVE